MDAYSTFLKQMADARMSDLRREARERGLSDAARAHRRAAARAARLETGTSRWAGWLRRRQPDLQPQPEARPQPVAPVILTSRLGDDDLRRSA